MSEVMSADPAGPGSEETVVVSSQTTVSAAAFRALSGSYTGSVVQVHFNPETLDYSVRNNLKDTGKGNTTKQYVSKVTAKLTMQLVFDTTHTGKNVLAETYMIRRYMLPPQRDETQKEEDFAPPVVEFAWGAFRFSGMLEGYRESIEFFSAEGMPLRATLSIELAQQDVVISAPDEQARAGGSGVAGGALEPAIVPAPQGPGGSASVIAARGGDPRSARALGAANGMESLRFGAGGALAVPRDVKAASAVPLARAASDARAAAGGAFSALRTSGAHAARGALDARRLLGDVNAAATLEPRSGEVSVTGRALGVAGGGTVSLDRPKGSGGGER